MNETVLDPGDLGEKVIEGLIAGEGIKAIAARVGMGAYQLTQRVDIGRLAATLSGLEQAAQAVRLLNDSSQQTTMNRRWVEAMDFLALVADRCKAPETVRRACVAMLRGPAPLCKEKVPRSGPAPEAQTRAAELLRRLLANGPLAAKGVMAEARRRGVSLRTLRRAKRALGVITVRKGFQTHACFLWRLPASGPAKKVPAGLGSNLATYGVGFQANLATNAAPGAIADRRVLN